MTPEEFSLSHHEIKLELELYRRVGRAFQDLFEQIMQKSDPSFLMVKPMGRAGDWKSDGFSLNTGTVFQCYAPEELTGPETARKIIEDFSGGRDHWKEKMRAWTFVWSSARALPPQVVNVLTELKANHPHIAIGHIGREGLWQIVKLLPMVDRIAILGPVPDLSAAPATTAAEIQVLMKHLGKQTANLPDDSSFDLTAIGDKLARNRLSAAVTNTVRPAMPVARLVREYVTKMPDPSFSEVIAIDLASKYRELAESADDPDVIFGSLVDYVVGEQRVDQKFYWAAAGIVAHYFELCDIFER
ncbi:MAG: hypothetical protein NTZ56_02355 [Acidobacteria bacterium]|nr:hypothetical protein [Acidobacteriota bacterium]